jgi:acetyltransferase-like isoleucine patch superfamily enzyme
MRRLLNAILDRNYRVARLLARRSGGPFVCRGAIELTLAADAIVTKPSVAPIIGTRLLGLSTPSTDVTTVFIAADATLDLDGAIIGRGCRITVGPHGRLSIGQGTYLTDGSRVAASRGIQIGRSCAISWGVTIIDDDGHGSGDPPYSAPVIIGDHVWIGCNVTILKGVTIGDGSVIGAGSVVTRPCPANTLIAGVPARTVKSGITWTDAGRASS